MTSLTFLPHEIVDEFAAHTRTPREDQLSAFARQRIAAWAVAGAPGSGEFCVGFARVEPLADGRFEFADDGLPAPAVIALDAFGEPADIVAWRPGWIASWRGRAAILGEQHVDGPRLSGSLTIFPEPYSWLQGHREGVVLVDPPRAARSLRGRDPFLAAGGIEHAAQLVTLLTAPPPEVLVPILEQERRAA